jgi:hypothetical protein
MAFASFGFAGDGTKTATMSRRRDLALGQARLPSSCGARNPARESVAVHDNISSRWFPEHTLREDERYAREGESVPSETSAVTQVGDKPPGKTVPQDSKDAFNSPLAALLPLLGGVIYVLLRGEYVRIYDRFGLRPEDVGIDLYAVLTGAALVFPGELTSVQQPTSFAAHSAINLRVSPLVAVVGAWREERHNWVSAEPRRDTGRGADTCRTAERILSVAPQRSSRLPRFGICRRPARLEPTGSAVVVHLVWRSLGHLRTMRPINIVMLYVAFVLVITIAFFLVWVRVDVHRATDRIKNGQRVRPGDFSFLAVQAYPANVHWVDQGKALDALTNQKTLLYLGEANDQVVLYNYCTHGTWRVPESAVIVDLQANSKTGLRCHCG